MAPEGSPIIYHNLLHWVETYQPEAWSLRGAHIIEPISQGDYDGLCGLYCIINAIRLVMAPHRELKHQEVRALFRAGVRFLERRGNLSTAVRSSVGARLWPQLAERLRATAQRMSNRSIILERPALRKDAELADTWRTIERMITSGKAPVLFMRGKYRHYSVISGYTPASLKLFDSFGYHWVRRASCGTINADAQRRLVRLI
jgi:hypothetical protein